MKFTGITDKESWTRNQRSILKDIKRGLDRVVSTFLNGGSDPVADDIIRAREIEIVDDDGNLRTFFGLDANGELAFYMFDSERHPRLQLVLDPSGKANLAINDKSSRDVVGACVDDDGEGQIFIKDGRGVPCASIAVQKNGTTTLGLTEVDTKLAVQFRLNSDGLYEGYFEESRRALRRTN